MMNRLIFLAIATSGCWLGAMRVQAQDGRPVPPEPPKPPIHVHESADGRHAITITHPDTMITGVPGRSEDLALFVEPTGEERKLDADSRELLTQYRKSSDKGDRKRIEGELRRVLADQFSARQKSREKEIERLEAEIERLREVHQRRNEQSERIIEDRVQQLLRDASGLGWGDDASLTNNPLHGFSFRTQVPLGAPLDVVKRFEVDIKRAEADAAYTAANVASAAANLDRKKQAERQAEKQAEKQIEYERVHKKRSLEEEAAEDSELEADADDQGDVEEDDEDRLGE